MSFPSNHPGLGDLDRLTLGEIARLPAEHLARLQEQADQALRSAKASKDWLDGAITQRYVNQAYICRHAQGRDTGTVRFDDGPVTVVADLPKRVDWDQTQLADLVERIKANGEDPHDYVEISFKVAEAKYTAWPHNIQAAFQNARTVRTGKETFKLMLAEGGR